jgi:hypothetical protein
MRSKTIQTLQKNLPKTIKTRQKVPKVPKKSQQTHRYLERMMRLSLGRGRTSTRAKWSLLRKKSMAMMRMISGEWTTMNEMR